MTDLDKKLRDLANEYHTHPSMEVIEIIRKAYDLGNTCPKCGCGYNSFTHTEC